MKNPFDPWIVEPGGLFSLSEEALRDVDDEDDPCTSMALVLVISVDHGNNVCFMDELGSVYVRSAEDFVGACGGDPV